MRLWAFSLIILTPTKRRKRGCRVAKDRIGIISFKIFSLTNLLARIKWMASKLFRKKTFRLMNEAGTVEERQVGKRRKEERQRQAEAGRGRQR